MAGPRVLAADWLRLESRLSILCQRLEMVRPRLRLTWPPDLGSRVACLARLGLASWYSSLSLSSVSAFVLSTEARNLRL